MRKPSRFYILLPIVLWMSLMMSGCSSSSLNATGAVESYLEALAAKDLNQMINLSCSDWEADAKLEFNSFAADKIRLEEVECLENRQDDDLSIVECTGRIVASYGAEDLVIELEEWTFRVLHQGGETLMCGHD